MKTISWLVFVGLSQFAVFMGYAKTERVELGIERVLVPQFGYDDNDQIEITVTGRLPNACHSLSDYFVDIQDDGQTIVVKQYVEKEVDGVCAHPDSLPEYRRLPIPFNREVRVGRLNAALYSIRYKTPDQQDQVRTFQVSAAPVSTVDSVPYGEVTDVSVKDFWKSGENIVATLTGFSHTSCTELDPNIRIEQIGDVYVVLPVLRVLNWVRCNPSTEPFEARLNLGRARPGVYLLHVRSQSGRGLSRVITVN